MGRCRPGVGQFTTIGCASRLCVRGCAFAEDEVRAAHASPGNDHRARRARTAHGHTAQAQAATAGAEGERKGKVRSLLRYLKRVVKEMGSNAAAAAAAPGAVRNFVWVQVIEFFFVLYK